MLYYWRQEDAFSAGAVAHVRKAGFFYGFSLCCFPASQGTASAGHNGGKIVPVGIMLQCRDGCIFFCPSAGLRTGQRTAFAPGEKAALPVRACLPGRSSCLRVPAGPGVDKGKRAHGPRRAPPWPSASWGKAAARCFPWRAPCASRKR